MRIVQLNKKAIYKIKHQKRFLENKLKVKLEVLPGKITISGSELNEYEASRVLEAIDKGFSIETSLLLKNEDYVFEIINIKNISPRKNLALVRARIIGTKGKTLKVIKGLTDCDILLKDNQIFIIGPTEKIKDALNGLRKLIQGSKQSSTYSYLEKRKKHSVPDDLGLKIK